MEKASSLIDLLDVCDPKPLEGDAFDSFYVETSEARGQNASKMLSIFFKGNKHKNKKALFMGHRGSGKSTELWKVQKELESDFKVISFSIRDEIDIIDLKYIDLIFIIMKKLLDSLEEDNIKLNNYLIDNLYDYWYGKKILEIVKVDKYDSSINAEAKLSFLNQIILSAKGILSTGKETKEILRKDIEPSLSELITSINDIIDNIKLELKKINKVPLIIVEDLDKLAIPVAEDLFLNHKNILTELNIHIIYTFPIFLRYSNKYNEIKDAFSLQELLSVIKTKNIDGSEHIKGKETLKKIIEMRTNTNLFDNGVLDFIIDKTGGLLRNILEIITKSTLNSISNNLNPTLIDINSVNKAYLELKSDFERIMRKEHIDKLKEIYNDPEKKALSDDILMDLLYNTSVIEYNGERWCNLHPAVEEILKERNLI